LLDREEATAADAALCLLPQRCTWWLACDLADHVVWIWEEEFPGDPSARDLVALRRDWAVDPSVSLPAAQDPVVQQMFFAGVTRRRAVFVVAGAVFAFFMSRPAWYELASDVARFCRAAQGDWNTLEFDYGPAYDAGVAEEGQWQIAHIAAFVQEVLEAVG
jgi:hypothetical protein